VSLGDLRPDRGAKRKRRRVGCGPGSGRGKTSGRGNKGAGQHSSSEFDSRFEGGQMPFYRRIPKRGFSNFNRTEYAIVNVGKLAELGADEVTVDLLREKRLVRKGMPVKVLGSGDVTKAIKVTAHAFTKSAREKIEHAGGKAEVVA
jgi:large subunit ribosomal protein L15